MVIVPVPAMEEIDVAWLMHRMDRHALKARLFEVVTNYDRTAWHPIEYFEQIDALARRFSGLSAEARQLARRAGRGTYDDAGVAGSARGAAGAARIRGALSSRSAAAVPASTAPSVKVEPGPWSAQIPPARRLAGSALQFPSRGDQMLRAPEVE